MAVKFPIDPIIAPTQLSLLDLDQIFMLLHNRVSPHEVLRYVSVFQVLGNVSLYLVNEPGIVLPDGPALKWILRNFGSQRIFVID